MNFPLLSVAPCGKCVLLRQGSCNLPLLQRGRVDVSCVEQDVAFIRARFNLRGREIHPAWLLEPEICSVGKAGVVTSPILLLQPERINPELNQKGYNVKSDVWSLGITMVTPRAGICVCSPGVGMGFGQGKLYSCSECPSSWTQLEPDSSGQSG